jgi:NADH:ubiquinone oxidoreductase subunit 5 (subunit L)/multisubunit Na+/H+ antiporter MnhA subunit
MILHAYIKIFMFLVIGGIILHCNGCQDIRWMGGLLPYIPVLWVAYVSGGICLIGLPYWSGYYSKYYIMSALSNSFVLFKGVEYILLLSYFFTVFYVCRAGYLIFLGPKNGHRKIYRLKPTSLLYTFDLFILLFVILFSSYIWINLLYTSKQLIYNNIFIKSFYYFNYITIEISKDLLYFWIIIYLLNFFVIAFWIIISWNFSWNFLKFLNIFIFFIFIFFLNFIIDIFYLLYV